jgi:protein-disulfide isomerase
MSSRKQRKEQLRRQRLAAEAQEQSAERRRRLVQYGSATIFLALCALVVLIVVSQAGGGSGGDTHMEDVGLVQSQLRGIRQADTVLGDPRAKATVVEFGDLQCPVCRAFSYQIAPQLISGPVRRGEAKYEFRQFPILGSDSVEAAKAALAAGEQGRYWNFVELFYRNQGVENSGYVTDPFLEAVATAAGVPDMAKWNRDRQSSRWDSELSANQSAAQGLGFTGTPSILVQGPAGQRPFNTVPSLDQIKSAIQSTS